SPDPPAARLSQQTKPDDVAPSLHGHYSRFITTTNHSAPAPRIGTLSLVVFATWLSPFTSKQQVPTFRSKACHTVTSPIHRMPHGQRQVPAMLVPGLCRSHGFDTIYMLSMPHQRFTFVRLGTTYLTGLARLFRQRSHHDS